MERYMTSTRWDRRFLDLAKLVGTWSKDPSTQVGAAIVDSARRVVSVGYNGFPRGVEDTEERLNDRDLKYSMVVHAECNAMLFAREPLGGCTLYTWPFAPCSACAGMIIQSGITMCVAPKNNNPRWVESIKISQKMFTEAGVALWLLEDDE
jgi:dCMP deaminase